MLVLGAIVSGAMTVALASMDLNMMRRIKAIRDESAEVPIAGSLTGRNAFDGQDWPPRLEGSVPQYYNHLVLFTLKGDESVQFWREVAAPVVTVMPSVKFVGVCYPAGECEIQRDSSVEPLTILGAMDPLQMRAVAVADATALALLYQDSRLSKRIVLDKPTHAVADEILSTFRARNEAGTP